MPDTVEIPGRVVEHGDLLPAFPGQRHGLGGGLDTNLHAVRSDERALHLRADILHELPEVMMHALFNSRRHIATNPRRRILFHPVP